MKYIRESGRTDSQGEVLETLHDGPGVRPRKMFVDFGGLVPDGCRGEVRWGVGWGHVASRPGSAPAKL